MMQGVCWRFELQMQVEVGYRLFGDEGMGCSWIGFCLVIGFVSGLKCWLILFFAVCGFLAMSLLFDIETSSCNGTPVKMWEKKRF